MSAKRRQLCGPATRALQYAPIISKYCLPVALPSTDVRSVEGGKVCSKWSIPGLCATPRLERAPGLPPGTFRSGGSPGGISH